MLTDIEKERLDERDSLAMKIKTGNDFVVRKKLKTWLADIDDVNFILTKLPDKQLNKLISNKTIFGLMRLVENLLYTIGVPHVVEGEYTPSGKLVRRPTEKTVARPSLRRGFYDVMRKAQPEELERRDYLMSHIINLTFMLSDNDIITVTEDIFKTCPEVKAYILSQPKPPLEQY